MTPSDILSELRALLPDCSAIRDPAIELEGPVYSSAKSKLYRLRNRQDGPDWAVKYCWENTHEVAQEYEALCYLQARVKGHDFGFAAPVLVHPSQGLLVVHWIPGERLERLIKKYSSVPERTSAYVVQSGRWLRQLHHFGESGDGTILSERLVGRLADDLSGLHRHVVMGRIANRSLGVLKSTAEAIGKVNMPTGLLHGDYKPENVLCHDGKVVGIDVALKFENVIVRDISHFLNHVSLNLLARYPWMYARYSRELEARFLEGYGWASVGVPDVALLWFRTYSALNQLATRLEGASFVGQNWLGIWAIAVMLMELTAQLRKTIG